MKIKKGDKIIVNTGKYKGTKSTIEKVLPKSREVLVKDVNINIRHLKQVEGEGGRVKVTKPINISNVTFICPKCEKPSRLGYKIEGNKKVRFCKKCQEII